jgi:heterodisulfide reductase subunit A
MTDEKKVTDAGTSEPKTGVYICYCGGNISDHVDVEALREKAIGIPGVAVARTNQFMCSDPGQELIMEDLKSGAVDRVVVASCAPSLHETTFRSAIKRAGGNPYIYEHANIREQVSWVHHGDAATEKATRLVAAAAAKAGLLKPLEPIRVDATQHATVIGGGVAGLRAAKDLAGRGIDVLLIEKSPFLGGQTATLSTVAPTGEEAADLVQELAGQVLSDPAITVQTCSQVTAVDGYIGNFTLRVVKQPPESPSKILKQSADSEKESGAYISFHGVYHQPEPEKTEESTLKTGVIVMATGFSTYQPRSGEYAYGETKHVITLPELIKAMALNSGNGQMLEFNGQKVRSVAMIHCVGSRLIPGIHEEDETGYLNEYCSRTCCTAILHAANTIRETFPDTHVFDFYRDIRTYGRGQEDVYDRASHNNVVFMRFEADSSPEVLQNQKAGDYPLTIRVKDTLTFGETVEVPVDLVVLAVGMEPNNVSDIVEMMKLPVGTDRFLLEVHPKLRPVEVAVGGVFLAGTCQAPMDIGEACNAAGAAAVKTSALLVKGFVELDPFVAEVDTAKCVGTGACLEACLNPGALNLIDTEINGKTVKRAHVTSALCLGCGACTAVCPENAININGWTLQQYEAMVDMIVAEDVAA